MKLFVFEYDNECDYRERILVQANSEKEALDIYSERSYQTYLSWVKKSPKDPNNPYFIPYRTKEEFIKDEDSAMCEGRSLVEHKLIAAYEVSPNKNPIIL